MHASTAGYKYPSRGSAFQNVLPDHFRWRRGTVGYTSHSDVKWFRKTGCRMRQVDLPYPVTVDMRAWQISLCQVPHRFQHASEGCKRRFGEMHFLHTLRQFRKPVPGRCF